MIERTAQTVIDRKKLPSRADVLKAKEENIAKDIAGIIGENRHAAYLETVKELSESYAFGILQQQPSCRLREKSQKSAEEKYIPESPVHLPATGKRYVKGKTEKDRLFKTEHPFSKKPQKSIPI